MLTWSVDSKPDHVLIHLHGGLCLGPQLRQFSSEALALLSSDTSRGLLIDMRGVEEIDSAGLGELVILYTAAGQVGCAVCLLGVGTRVARLLDITRLSALFPQFDDVESALRLVRQKSNR